MQLTLFEMEPSYSDLERRIEAVHQKSEKVRRGIYAEHTELKKMYHDLKHEFDMLKASICKANQTLNTYTLHVEGK